MISIKDIYQWYVQYPAKEPRPPKKLTPLQLVEWTQENSQAIKDFENNFKNKSFIGERLTLSPAELEDITVSKLKAIAHYSATSGEGFEDGYTVTYILLSVNYELFYDTQLYETIRLMYNKNMVEFDGEIIKFNSTVNRNKTVKGNEWDSYNFSIHLKLSSIKVIKRRELKPSLIGAAVPKNSNCFIATAAFGHPDQSEVIQLREFRDKVLVNSTFGRLFISTYAFISPPIALIIRQNNWLRALTRSFLRKAVMPTTVKISKFKKQKKVRN